MSKQTKRKITVNLAPKKALPKARPSVFERLGTKASTVVVVVNPTSTPQKDYCHHWAQGGTCPFGKSCKYSSTHTLTSPSKQRAAKNQVEPVNKRRKDAPKRPPGGNAGDNEDWEQWDAEELADADPDDLEKRRQELQRELELQMKMENKARKKDKKIKKESSPSSDSTSSSSESSSSSDDSSSSSSSSIDTRRKKTKKLKTKRDSSSSSEERPKKPKIKTKRPTKKVINADKLKKAVKVKTKSPSPIRSRKQSQTPPPKIKPTIPAQIATTKTAEPKSPRPLSRSSKEKPHTPSPKPKEKEPITKDKDILREKEKEQREKLKEKPIVKEKERKKDSKSPKRELKPAKRRETPDSSHSRDRKASPSRSKGSNSSRKDVHKSPPPSRDAKKADEKDRTRSTTSKEPARSKDKRDSRDRERERDRERRIAREEREAAREKEREEALARCQERQRERERLKEAAKKEEEAARARTRERPPRGNDRGLDKPASDRVERLLPLPEDRLPPARKHSSRDRRERTPPLPRAKTPPESRRDLSKERYERGYERAYDNREREYPPNRRLDDKEFDSPYDRSRHETDRRFMELDEHYNDNSREENRSNEGFNERRSRREMWDGRKEQMERDLEHRRYNRDEARPAGAGAVVKNNWDEYPEQEWEQQRGRREEWGENWEGNKHGEEEWKGYGGWNGDDRARRWPGVARDRSRPRSSTSHRDDTDAAPAGSRKEAVPRPEPKPLLPEPEKETPPIKRAAEEPPEPLPESKKPCIIETPLEDDLSEISDDADEILNRDEEIAEAIDIKIEIKQEIIDAPLETVEIKVEKADTPPPQLKIKKDESIDEDNMDLDFEEISEDELEEESRVKGIGDALGVDWASLVAESRPRTKPTSSAKRLWESHNVLVNLGVSVHLAGEDLAKEILQEHTKNDEEHAENQKEAAMVTSDKIGAIQVANREKMATRKALFSTVGPHCRALCARRDLMIRRHLCNLPLKDNYVEVPKRHDPELQKLAVQLFERCL